MRQVLICDCYVEVRVMFQAGVSGNPKGRPKGTCGGRVQALVELDRILARRSNKLLLSEVLQSEFRADPLKFFKTVIMPLLPRESKLAMDHDGIIDWKSLLGDEPGEKPQ
jgi:hypothetical protein